MEAKNKIIEEFYEKFNYPGLSTLYKNIRVKHKHISKDEVKNYLDDQTENQIFKKQPIENKKIKGKITALAPNETWQMDLLDVSTYAKQNKKYNFILLVVDIFTRKAYAKKCKSKSSENVIKAFESILDEAGESPMTISCDNESAFLSSEFEDILDSHYILLEPNIVNDHAGLGVIDAFCKKLRMVVVKDASRNGTNWIDVLPKFMKNYNNMPNSALEDIAPDDANKKDDNEALIFEKNLIKSKSNLVKSDLSTGDNVRIRVATQYTKASEPQFSDKVLKVVSTQGGNIKLSNGQ